LLLSDVALGREFQSPAGRAARAEMLGIMAVDTEGFKVFRVKGYIWVVYIRRVQVLFVVGYVGGLAAAFADVAF